MNPRLALRTAVLCRRWVSRLPHWVLDYSLFRVFELPPLPAETGQEVTLSVRTVGREDLTALAACRRMGDLGEGAARMAKRLDEGMLSVALWDGELVAGYGWGRVGTNVLEDRDRYRMALGPGGGYIHDLFIDPAHRGQGLFPVIVWALERELGRGGAGRFFSTVEVTNVPSLKAHAKIGAKVLETVTYLGVLGVRVHTARYDGGRYGSVRLMSSGREFVSRVARGDGERTGT